MLPLCIAFYIVKYCKQSSTFVLISLFNYVSSDNCAVYFFERKRSVSMVNRINISSKGKFDKIPNGFMDEWELSLDDLLEL